MTRMFQSQFGHILFLALFAALLMLRGLGDNSLGYPDADRILMDGVFLRDTMVDLPFVDPWAYAQAYFAQYPALSIGYRPPFFPLVEGLFNLVFGVNMWSSRLALFSFVLLGIVCWYKMIRPLAGATVAMASALLWLSTPFLVQWAWYTMAELAVLSVSLCALYYMVRWVEHGQARDVVCLALAIGIAAWTKQTAAFLALAVVFALVAKGRAGWALRQPAHYGAAALLVVILVPLVLMTMVFGDQNIHQSVGDGTAEGVSRFSLENWVVHLKTLVQEHLELPLRVLVVVGGAVALYHRHRALWLPTAVILAVYIFFSLLVGKNPRYPIFWIPFWALLAALPLGIWGLRSGAGRVYAALLGATVLFQAGVSWRQEPLYVTGYDTAAREAVTLANGSSVFVDAHHNGYFTYFARQADRERRSYVLRGDKLLSSSSIIGGHWEEVHASSEADILKIFDELAVKAVVVESLNYSHLEIHAKLRTLTQDETLFEHVRSIPIRSNRVMSSAPGSPRFDENTLELYRYREAKDSITGDINLRLPVVGKTIVKKAGDEDGR